MNQKNLIWLIVIVVLLVVIIVSFVSNHNTEDVIYIGLISPFTGEGANYGKAARTATDLAVDEINAKGGLRGKELVVIYEDDQGLPKEAVSAFQKLVSVDNVKAILGPFYSSNVLACAPIAERQQVVLLTPTATSDEIRDAGEFVFRVCPSNNEQSKTIARFAIKNLKLSKSFILYRNVDYGVTLRDAFKEAFTEEGGTILGIEAVAAEASDVRAQLTKVKSTNPEFIFAAVHYPEGSAILRQSKEMGISSTIIGTDGGFDPELLKRAGDAAEGSYWVTIGWGDEKNNPAVARFKDAYYKQYNEFPGVYSGLFYDATKILGESIESAESLTGTGIQKDLLKATYEGPTGRTKFDSKGDVDKPFAIFRVQNGEFIPVSVKM